MPADPRWLDPEAAARYLSVRADALGRLVRAGRKPAPTRHPKTKKRVWDADAIDANFANPAPIKRRRLHQRYDGPLETAGDVLAKARPWLGGLSGIYFLIADKSIVYVGQSVNVAERALQHAAERDFDAWYWVPCHPAQLNAMERAYIDALMPPWNMDAMTCRMRKQMRNV